MCICTYIILNNCSIYSIYIVEVHKDLTTNSLEKEPDFAAFDNFHGVNAPTQPNNGLLTGLQIF